MTSVNSDDIGVVKITKGRWVSCVGLHKRGRVEPERTVEEAVEWDKSVPQELDSKKRSVAGPIMGVKSFV